MPTSAMDLVPTILSILGLDAPGTPDGRVLVEALAGRGDAPAVETVTLAPQVPGQINRNVVTHRIGNTTVVHGSAQATA